MQKHSELPWGILPEECDKPYIRIRGTVLGGRYKIANVLTPVYEGVHEREAQETRANAALIVRAVNAHADLVAALEYIISPRGQLPGSDAMKKARAALAKAKA